MQNNIQDTMSNVDNSSIRGERPISFMEKFTHNIVPKINGIGAAIVIVGAMFKLLSWPGGPFMLGLGLSTEALIFFISAFQPPAREYDWRLVFPQLDPDYAYKHGLDNINNVKSPLSGLSGSAKRDNLTDLLQECKVDKVSIERLTIGIKNLSTVCQEVGHFNKVNVDWDNLSNSFTKVNDSLNKIVVTSSNITVSLDKINNSFMKLSEGGVVSEMENKTTEVNAGLTSLNTKIAEMNKSYDNVLRALKG